MSGWNEHDYSVTVGDRGQYFKPTNSNLALALNLRSSRRAHSRASGLLIRSFSFLKRHRRRLAEMIQALDLNGLPDTPLAYMYRQRHHGLHAPYVHDRTLTETEWRNNLADLFSRGSYSADTMMEVFQAVKVHLAPRKFMIVHTTGPNSEFLIGDCPVLPLAAPNGLAQEPFGPSVDAYFFPLGPKYALFTGNHSEALTSGELDYFNRLQVVNAERWVVWSSDIDFTKFTNSVLDS